MGEIEIEDQNGEIGKYLIGDTFGCNFIHLTEKNLNHNDMINLKKTNLARRSIIF